MSQINKYPNNEAYASDTDRSIGKSSVSYIAQNGELLYDGVNVVVAAESADVGDLAVYDKTAGAIKFIKSATVAKEQIPASLVPLAVVYAVRGDRLYVVSLDNAVYNGSASIRWAASYEVALAGFDLAAGGTFILRINATDYPFTYAAGATLGDIAAQINANTTIKSTYGWMATATGEAIIMTSNTYSAAYAAIEVVSGCVITRTPEDKNYQATLTGVLIDGPTEYIRRKNGVNAALAGCNTEAFLKYYSANGSTKTGQKPGSAEIIRESVFTEAANPALVAAYPTYKDYLLGEHMLQYPSAYGAILRDGKTNTAKIGRLRFVNIRGETVPCYPAASAALDYGVTVEGAATGLEAGAWWLPSVEEVYLLMKDRVLKAADAESDPINRTLSRLGKATCYGSNYYPWTSCEYDHRYAFFYNGNTGVVANYSKYSTNYVRPVSIISIK